jgi:hypothetical protein
LFFLVTGCSDGNLATTDPSSAPFAAVTRSADTVADAGTSINFLAQELLGRPTDHSIAVKAVTDQAVEAYLDYGTASGVYTTSTLPATFSDGVIEVDLDGLSAGTTYYYRLRYRAAGSSDDFIARTEHTFVTQRPASGTFTFDVQSDSHQGYAAFYTSALYGVTMQNILNDHPDLLFDLGDAVSQDDQTETAAAVEQKYQNQRTYFDIVGHSTSVFLVLGNHEREEGWYLDDFGSDVADTRPVLGANARKLFFLNPVPNDFYSGNGEQVPELSGDHLRGDYYAFEWGSALFVAIDPFWYTMTKPYAGAQGGEVDDAVETVGTRWDWTLGKAQYDWLTQTLAGSTKPFKFVLAHHPTGGTSDYVRGGALGAKYCEWGGYDIDGTTYSFATNRPGWAMPVHQLLVANGVTAFIHGHDHIFAKEELDGIVYQEVPQPADSKYGTGFSSNAQDYAGATTLHNSGHLRFTVSPVSVQVDYVSAYLQGDGQNGSVAYTYTMSPCPAVNSDGRACDDGNACTINDTCVSGSCVGTPTSDTCVSNVGGAAGAGGASAGGASGGATVGGTGGVGGRLGTGGRGVGFGGRFGAGGRPGFGGRFGAGGRLGFGGGASGIGGATSGAPGTSAEAGAAGASDQGESGQTNGTGNGTGGGSTAPPKSQSQHGSGSSHHSSSSSRGSTHPATASSGGSTSEAAAGEPAMVAQAGEASGGRGASDETGGTHAGMRGSSPIKTKSSSGCGCVVAGESGGDGAALLGVFTALATVVRRRRRRSSGAQFGLQSVTSVSL